MKQQHTFWALFAALLLLPGLLVAQGLFTKVTDASNPIVSFANVPARYKGHIWIDFDGDNRTDLFTSPKFMFKNLGNGQFARLPDGPALGQQNAQGASMADIDNDGDPDLITAQKVCNLFFMNDTLHFDTGTGLLANIANYPAWDCALADANNDGRLDLLFVHANGFHTPNNLPCRFYLQNASGGFDPITGHEFTDVPHPYTVPTWSDFDLDGDVDLFIGSGPAGGGGQPDYCYKNLLKETGAFALERLSDQHWATPQDGQVYNFIDYDLDGDLDAMLTNYSQMPTRFYRNDNGTYVAQNFEFTQAVGHLANCWGDLDLDGDEDMLISTDASLDLEYYENLGNGSFAPKQIAGSIPATGTTICGVALADYDNDGDLDIYTNGPNDARALFKNGAEATNRHWAEFTLQGGPSNRSALGTRLWIKANIGGVSRWITREVQAHNSFQSQNDLRQHVGLGQATAIDSLVVRWPSGNKQTFTGLASNLFYKIVEGQDITVIVAAPEPAETLRVGIGPNPFQDFFRAIFSNQSGRDFVSAELFDGNGRLVACRIEPQTDSLTVRTSGALAPGTYFFRINFKTGATTRMLIKH